MRRMNSLALALAIALSGSAQAATVSAAKTCGPVDERIMPNPIGPTFGILALTICEDVTTTEAITEVILSGDGLAQTFRYGSLAEAPGPASPGTALSDALNFFGYGPGQPIASTALTLFDSVLGPVTEAFNFSQENATLWTASDPTDIDSIVVLTGQLNVEVTRLFDVTNRFRLSVDLQGAGPGGPEPPAPTPVPLPATAPLLFVGLVGLAGFARTRRSRAMAKPS